MTRKRGNAPKAARVSSLAGAKTEVARLAHELQEATERQAATAEVLSLISDSPTDLQPVFERIVKNAARLCQSVLSAVYRRDGEHVDLVAHDQFSPESVAAVRKAYPAPLTSKNLISVALRERRVVHEPDVLVSGGYSELQRTSGYRSILIVPMLRDEVAIGAIAVMRLEPQLFPKAQVELLKTFAGQAVIAIENTRLLKELRQRTDDLMQSLQELRTTQDRLVQTEKLASLGQLTAGIAHEIKNPLNFVNNFSAVSTEMIDELREILSGISIDHKARSEINELTDTLHGNLEKVVQHGKRVDAIVKNMLLHSRQGSSEHRPVDINAVVEESLNLAYHGARAEKQDFNITLERSLDPTAGEVDLFPQEITRVLLNLISNGFYAATKRKEGPNGGSYEPTLAVVTKNLGDRVEIRIRDNGTGIPPEARDKLFNPFFTTKPAGEGTGLGLSISHDIIVKQHGGSIEVDTQPGEFTEFRIVLPRIAASLAASAKPA
jgi:two-component system NtrC family sensor kinase